MILFITAKGIWISSGNNQYLLFQHQFLQTTIAVFVRFWNRDSPFRSRFYRSSLHVSLIINTKVVFVSLFIRFGLHYLLNETERCWYIALAQPCSTRRPWFARPRPSPISAFKEKDSPKLVPRQGSDFEARPWPSIDK